MTQKLIPIGSIAAIWCDAQETTQTSDCVRRATPQLDSNVQTAPQVQPERESRPRSKRPPPPGA